MISGNLSNWKVDKDKITVTLPVANTGQNRRILALMAIDTQCAVNDTQGELTLEEAQ